MLIEDNRKNKDLNNFGRISNGAIFEHNNHIYIKMEYPNANNKVCNAVKLSNGYAVRFDYSEECRILNSARLVID